MRTTPFKLIALATAMSCGGVIVSSAVSESDPMLDKVADYRQWTRVTGDPLPVTVNAFNPNMAIAI